MSTPNAEDECPGDSTMCSFSAAEEIFGLDESEAEFLFRPGENGSSLDLDWDGPSEQASAKDVAKHIRRFVSSQPVSP